MSLNLTGRKLVLLLVAGLVVMSAGCTSGSGTQTYTGSSSSGGDVHLHSAKVVNGALRQLTISNNGSASVSSGTWRIKLNGTSNKKPASFNTTVNVGSIAANSTKSVSIRKGSQPDWQDGAKLTIQATSPGGTTTSITIKPK
ncbi:hypothetical protein [Halocalculus aciditolerans]|uniref:Uncharacterized protein n=1 Tax=Halocalculus aciditolerans TaxID=1383812 RepID=A0A830FQR1_9EURY|nr:hypothetical protein [Halocalculus aciditolerans]GGL71713.1 hypothetical protein GCM10009039_32230 [Halocalculus aciditolerans]